MSKLYVIRHAQVNVIPDMPASNWVLSNEGYPSTLQLIKSESWENMNFIYHSPEPKAKQTAQIIAEHFNLKMKVHNDLHELHANIGFPPADEFRARVGAFLEGYPDPDFEDYQKAADRMERGVKEIVEEANGRSVAIVSHGRIITAWYSRLIGRRLTRDEWQSIRLPDLSVVNTITWKVERGFLANVHV